MVNAPSAGACFANDGWRCWRQAPPAGSLRRGAGCRASRRAFGAWRIARIIFFLRRTVCARRIFPGRLFANGRGCCIMQSVRRRGGKPQIVITSNVRDLHSFCVTSASFVWPLLRHAHFTRLGRASAALSSINPAWRFIFASFLCKRFCGIIFVCFRDAPGMFTHASSALAGSTCTGTRQQHRGISCRNSAGIQRNDAFPARYLCAISLWRCAASLAAPSAASRAAAHLRKHLFSRFGETASGHDNRWRWRFIHSGTLAAFGVPNAPRIARRRGVAGAGSGMLHRRHAGGWRRRWAARNRVKKRRTRKMRRRHSSAPCGAFRNLRHIFRNARGARSAWRALCLVWRVASAHCCRNEASAALHARNRRSAHAFISDSSHLSSGFHYTTRGRHAALCTLPSVFKLLPA